MFYVKLHEKMQRGSDPQESSTSYDKILNLHLSGNICILTALKADGPRPVMNNGEVRFKCCSPAFRLFLFLPIQITAVQSFGAIFFSV
jgi:hypothetical protein